MRLHTEKNNKQHAAFLAQIGAGSADHAEAIAWFASLPLWLDLGELRVVHACWDTHAMDGLSTPFVDDEVMVNASTQGHAAYGWVENCAKDPRSDYRMGCLFSIKTATNGSLPGSAGHYL